MIVFHSEKHLSVDSLDILDRNMLTTRLYKPTSQQFDSLLQWGETIHGVPCVLVISIAVINNWLKNE